MQSFLDFINTYLSAPLMLGGVLIIGGYISVKTGFVQIRYLKRAVLSVISSAKMKKEGDGISPFQALAVALSGTLGTGNIAGVAAAVAIGGAGSIFWMAASAIFGMAVKYAEIVLAVKYRERKNGGYRGGAMYYIEKAGYKRLAYMFAACCLFASFAGGNMTQSNTARVALCSVLSLNDAQIRFTFLVISIIIGFVIFGGLKRVSRLTALLVPFLALFYIGCCAAVFLMDLSGFWAAVCEIFQSAFNFKAAAGGAGGALVLKAMRAGVTKGVFTNEAGIGSAPMAHAAAEAEYPAKQGLWGIFEVFLDTVVMCSMTGIVVVMSGAANDKSAAASSLAFIAFKHYLGGFAAFVIAVSTILFAVSAIIGWSYYGECAIAYLFGERLLPLSVYRILYVAAVYFGAVSPIGLVWGLADLFNGLMMLPNLAAVMLLTNVVKSETRRLEVKTEKTYVCGGHTDFKAARR